MLKATAEGSATNLSDATLNKLSSTDSIKYIFTTDASVAEVKTAISRSKEDTDSVSFASGKFLADKLSNIGSFSGNPGSVSIEADFVAAAKAAGATAAKATTNIKVTDTVKAGESANTGTVRLLTSLLNDYSPVTATIAPLDSGKGLGTASKTYFDEFVSAHSSSDNLTIDFATISTDNLMVDLIH